MNYIKKYTAIQVTKKQVDDNIEPMFRHGEIKSEGYYDVEPETEFDSEEEAIEWAYKESTYYKWLILPIIKFTDR